MGVERAYWQTGVNGHCDKCDLQDLQDEKHALFLCDYVVFVLFGTRALISSLRLLHRREFPLVLLLAETSRLSSQTTWRPKPHVN
eukprot:363076-Pelagomonas_calceolata.AAC.4